MMKAIMGRSLQITLIAFLVVLTQAGCHTKSEEQRILDSFQQKVNADIQRAVSAGRAIKGAPYHFDVEKTNSLVSPYIGTATITASDTPPHPLNAEERRAFATLLELSSHKLTYAYQDGHWVPRSEECYDDHWAWGPCAESSRVLKNSEFGTANAL
jgi:hypothetical protein